MIWVLGLRGLEVWDLVCDLRSCEPSAQLARAVQQMSCAVSIGYLLSAPCPLARRR